MKKTVEIILTSCIGGITISHDIRILPLTRLNGMYWSFFIVQVVYSFKKEKSQENRAN